jgi:hypothetical protein
MAMASTISDTTSDLAPVAKIWEIGGKPAIIVLDSKEFTLRKERMFGWLNAAVRKSEDSILHKMQHEPTIHMLSSDLASSPISTSP